MGGWAGSVNVEGVKVLIWSFWTEVIGSNGTNWPESALFTCCRSMLTRMERYALTRHLRSVRLSCWRSRSDCCCFFIRFKMILLWMKRFSSSDRIHSCVNVPIGNQSLVKSFPSSPYCESLMLTFFMPTSKHFFSLHLEQNLRVTLFMSQPSLNGQMVGLDGGWWKVMAKVIYLNPNQSPITLLRSALRRKNALHDMQVSALKLTPAKWKLGVQAKRKTQANKSQAHLWPHPHKPCTVYSNWNSIAVPFLERKVFFWFVEFETVETTIVQNHRIDWEWLNACPNPRAHTHTSINDSMLPWEEMISTQTSFCWFPVNFHCQIAPIITQNVQLCTCLLLGGCFWCWCGSNTFTRTLVVVAVQHYCSTIEDVFPLRILLRRRFWVSAPLTDSRLLVAYVQ